MRHSKGIVLGPYYTGPAFLILEIDHSLRAHLHSLGVDEFQCSSYLTSLGVICRPELYPLYLGQVIRVFEMGEYVVGFLRPLGSERD